MCSWLEPWPMMPSNPSVSMTFILSKSITCLSPRLLLASDENSYKRLHTSIISQIIFEWEPQRPIIGCHFSWIWRQWIPDPKKRTWRAEGWSDIWEWTTWHTRWMSIPSQDIQVGCVLNLSFFCQMTRMCYTKTSHERPQSSDGLKRCSTAVQCSGSYDFVNWLRMPGILCLESYHLHI